MNDVCFVTCCFKDTRYYRQQIRLIESINKFQPGSYVIPYKNELPLGARPHWESLYGFKVHAVAEARRLTGCNKIIWLDTACILQHPVDHLLTLAGDRGVVAIKDDNLLQNHIADKYLRQITHPPITGVHLVGGSLYVFDFGNPLADRVFTYWQKYEADGMFGSQAEQSSEQINKHRHDESMMALAMHQHGVPPCTHEEARYNSGPDSIVIKKHFK